MKAINWIQANGRKSSWMHKLLTFCVTLMSACAFAQAPAGGGAPPPYTAAELDQLVAPIALYPDDLVALILPASTYPLEIVQADRFLDKRKTDKNLKINDAWQDSVKSLLNYPDVVKKMSTEIDWTADLGEAVVADQSGVLEAIQRFRRKVQSVGNLKSDDKQTVIVEKEVIKVVQANPEVIYVPQYNPSTIVVSGLPTSGYYPSPYPVYYYPYPPGAAFATGLIWGAAIGAAWSNNHWDCHWGGGGNNNININRNTNINTGNINTGNTTRGSGQGTAWKSDKKPGQVSSGAGRTPRTDRVGDTGRGQGLGDRQGAGSRQDVGGRQDFGGRQGANGRDSAPSSRPSAGTSDRGGSVRDRASSGSYGDRGGSYGDRGGRGGDAFGGYGGGGNTRADSSRGAASRSSMSSGGGRGGSSFQGGGGGGRAAAGGGRSGGGGRRR